MTHACFPRPLRRGLLALWLAALGVGLSGCDRDPATAGAATTVDDEPAVALVNGQPISQALFDTILEVRAAGQGEPLSAAQRQEVLDDLITLEALAQQALAEGLHRRPRIAGELEAQRKTTLAQWLVQEYMQGLEIAEDEIRARYEQSMGTLEYNVRHILLDDETTARELIAALDGGADFGELAREHSRDPGSAAAGGQLGWLTADQVVAPFAAAMGELALGEHGTTPVESVFGWHVVRVDERRELERLTLEDVHDWVHDELRHEKLQARIDAIRAAAEVVRLTD